MKMKFVLGCLLIGSVGISIAQSLPPSPSGTSWMYEASFSYSDSDQIPVGGDSYLPVGYTNATGGYSQSSTSTVSNGSLSLNAVNLPAAGTTVGSYAYVVTANYVYATVGFSATDVLVNLENASQNFTGNKTFAASLAVTLPDGAGTLIAGTGILSDDFAVLLAPLSVSLTPSSGSATSQNIDVFWSSGEVINLSAEASVIRNLTVDQTTNAGIGSATESSPYVIVGLYTTYDRYRLDFDPIPEPSLALPVLGAIGMFFMNRRR